MMGTLYHRRLGDGYAGPPLGYAVSPRHPLWLPTAPRGHAPRPPHGIQLYK